MRWPTPSIAAILTLTGQYLAAGRDQEAYSYFRERAAAAPDQPIFGALEGTFQIRMAGQVFLLRRVAWVKDGIAKLDRAADTGHPVARYLRGVTLAELPARFGRAEQAVAELEWVLQQRDTLPPGLRRSVYRGLARAFTTLERRDEAQAALAQSGYPSLDPALPQFTADFSVTARAAFASGHRDSSRWRPGSTSRRGTTRRHRLRADRRGHRGHRRRHHGNHRSRRSRRPAPARSAPITHVILAHAHWDHVGGLAALKAPNTRVIAQARFADELRIVNDTGVPFRYFFGVRPSSGTTSRPIS